MRRGANYHNFKKEMNKLYKVKLQLNNRGGFAKAN